MFYKGELIEMSEEHSGDITDEISTHIVGWIVPSVLAQFVENLLWTVGLRASTRVHIYWIPNHIVHFVQNLWKKAKMFTTILKNILNHQQLQLKGE